jgi:hypothetical protein
MQDQPAPSRDGAAVFTLREAAAELGISLNTLRRRIAAGQIDAERVHRPQGHVWQVYLHGAGTQEHRANGTMQREGATVQPQMAPALIQAEAMAAYTRSILEPLVQSVDRLTTRVAELERENGRLSERLESTLTASTAPQSAEPTTEAPPARSSSTTWLTPRRFWTIAALVLVLIGVGVVQVTVTLFSMAAHLTMPW